MRILSGLFMLEVEVDHETVALTVSRTVFIEKSLNDSRYESCFAFKDDENCQTW